MSGIVHVLVRVLAAVRKLIDFKMICACVPYRMGFRIFCSEENRLWALVQK
jgi:hypothetical protein